MGWFQDLISGMQVDRRAIEERNRYKTVTEMAARGFYDLVAKRLKNAHGVTIGTITRQDRPVEVLIDFGYHDAIQVLRDVNDGIYNSIDDAVDRTALHLWQTWDSRFDQEPEIMRRYESKRGHPAKD